MQKTRRAAILSIASAALAPLTLAACTDDSNTGDDSEFGADGDARRDREMIIDGVTYYSEEHIDKLIHVLEVDLTMVSVDVLYPGTVSATSKPTKMAEEAGAAAVINGDFFNNSEDDNTAGHTNAPAGPMIKGGEHLSAAVPEKQRMGPPRDAGYTPTVIGFDGTKAQITDLHLEATATTPNGTIEIAALNQYAIPEDSVGLFNHRWGEERRRRATCGSDAHRHDMCSGNVTEVVVKDGRVFDVHAASTRADVDTKGEIELDAEGDIALIGRDAAHEQLKHLEEGDEVSVEFRLNSDNGSELTSALGGFPLLDGNGSRRADDNYEDNVSARTIAGYGNGGETLYMIVIEGFDDGEGATLIEAAEYAEKLGLEHALNLDGGGSSLLAAGQEDLMVRNSPTDILGERPVANALAVFPKEPEDGKGASSLEGRWEYRGDTVAQVATLEIEGDGSVTYFAEGSPAEFTGELEDPEGDWDYTAVVRATGDDADLVEEQEIVFHLTLSDDEQELEADGEDGVTVFERAG